MMKEVHYKINSKITSLQKDRDALANHPDADTNPRICTNEAIIAEEIAYLERKSAQNKKNELNAELASHSKKLEVVWSAISKDRKPRDTIRRLKIPNTNPPRYAHSSKNMVELARKYHDDLQNADLPRDQEDFHKRINLIMEEIPRQQILEKPNKSVLHQNTTEVQTEKALYLSKNGSATGMDRCPYELWKALKEQYDASTHTRAQGFNIIKVLSEVLTDIQTFGVDDQTDFALG